MENNEPVFLKKLTSAKDTFTNIKTDDLFHMITPEERVELQSTLLEMYQEVADVCQKYDIIPFLIGGSALGAVRHKGFIPWDDDLDIGMLRADYEKFKRVFKKELGNKYILNAPNYSRYPKARFPKIIKKETLLREIVDVDNERLNGVFLDIFIIENVPKGVIQRKLKGLLCNALEFISGQVFLVENLTPDAAEFYKRSGKGIFRLRLLIGKAFSFQSACRWFHVVDNVAKFNRDTGYLGIPTGRKHYFGEIFKEEVFLPSRYIEFCSIMVPVFHDTDTYLGNLYGNYMQIPDEKKREKHYIVEMKL